MQHYRGIYMLQEKVSRNNDRVNVTKFNASEDMSGENSTSWSTDTAWVWTDHPAAAGQSDPARAGQLGSSTLRGHVRT
jgi:hypothetical protein